MKPSLQTQARPSDNGKHQASSLHPPLLSLHKTRLTCLLDFSASVTQVKHCYSTSFICSVRPIWDTFWKCPISQLLHGIWSRISYDPEIVLASNFDVGLQLSVRSYAQTKFHQDWTYAHGCICLRRPTYELTYICSLDRYIRSSRQTRWHKSV